MIFSKTVYFLIILHSINYERETIMKKLYKISFIIVLVLGMFVAGFTKISANTVANVELLDFFDINYRSLDH